MLNDRTDVRFCHIVLGSRVDNRRRCCMLRYNNTCMGFDKVGKREQLGAMPLLANPVAIDS